MNSLKFDKTGSLPLTVSKEIGNRYNRWTIKSLDRIEKSSNGTSYNYYVRCKCDCGKEKVHNLYGVKNGLTKSCGCYSSELKSKRFLKHGLSRSRIYVGYYAMINRCYNPANKKYKLYGGKGVVVCERWKGENGFINFKEDMGAKPIGFSIDRKNGDKNYSCGRCPECVKNGWDFNCRWVDSVVQNRNTNRNRYIMFNGESMTISEISRKTGLSETLINYRLRSGWTEKDAISLPVIKGKRTDKRNLYGTSKYKNKHCIKR